LQLYKQLNSWMAVISGVDVIPFGVVHPTQLAAAAATGAILCVKIDPGVNYLGVNADAGAAARRKIGLESCRIEGNYAPSKFKSISERRVNN
jgi:hypothetical protein